MRSARSRKLPACALARHPQAGSLRLRTGRVKSTCDFRGGPRTMTRLLFVPRSGPATGCPLSVSVPPNRPRRVVVLGSTGSIGTSTLDVIAHLPDRLQTAGLSAHSRWQEL